MLTKEHAIARYDFQRLRILPDRLTSGEHAQYLQFADRMLDVYRTGIGRRRRDLHRDVHRIFEDEVACPLRRIDGFCKLLDDQSKYADAGRWNAKRKFCMPVKRHLFPTSCFATTTAERC